MVAVRLDSGDLLADSTHVRRVLDEAGLRETKVLVSGDIDEFRIADLLAAGAPIAGFGVGGNLAVGLGTVASGTVGGVLGAVYKLVWYEGGDDPARIKLAGEKSTWPGRKLVYRIGEFEEDVIQLDDEPAPARRHAPCSNQRFAMARSSRTCLPCTRSSASDRQRAGPPRALPGAARPRRLPGAAERGHSGATRASDT